MRQVPVVDTVEPMVVPGPLAWEGLPPRRRHPGARGVAAIIVLLTAIVVLAGAVFVELPYYALAPGSAREVVNLVNLGEGAPSHPPSGKVLFTTVSLDHVRPVGAVLGWLDPDVDVLHEDAILPPEADDEDYRRLNRMLMDDSQQTAVVVALRRLGYDVPERGNGGLVARVMPGTAADGHLEPGEVIVAVDGRHTPRSDEVVAAVRRHHPGEAIRLDVAAPDGSGARTVELVLGENPNTGEALLGVEIRTAGREFDLPFPVVLDAGPIGGPSAGLAFTLGVIDVLSPGELTGGRRVAVTGTMNIDGTVGEIGGIAQKTAAVRRAGIGIFLVPASLYDEAKERAGDDLEVIPVRNLEEALDALGRLGGDLTALGPPPPGAEG